MTNEEKEKILKLAATTIADLRAIGGNSSLSGFECVKLLARKLRSETHLDERSRLVGEIASSDTVIAVLGALISPANSPEDQADLLRALEYMSLPKMALELLLESAASQDIDIAEAAVFASRGLSASERRKFYQQAGRRVHHVELHEVIENERRGSGG